MGMLGGGALVTMLAAWTILAVLGIHGLLLGRMPGSRLYRRVRRPRLWGVGALAITGGWSTKSPSLAVIGLGLIAISYPAIP
ncbi:hypothetical protein [Streptomyces sp. NPDC001205]